MQLLVEEHKKEIELLDGDIQSCNSTIAASDGSRSFVEREKELNMGLERLSRDLITQKEKKLARDRKAFQINKAYIWPSSSQPFQPRANKRFYY